MFPAGYDALYVPGVWSGFPSNRYIASCGAGPAPLVTCRPSSKCAVIPYISRVFLFRRCQGLVPCGHHAVEASTGDLPALEGKGARRATKSASSAPPAERHDSQRPRKVEAQQVIAGWCPNRNHAATR